VLRVTLPKREEAKSRRIEVSGTDAAPKTIDTKTSDKAKEVAGGR
jgi:hypothetical protein